MIIRPAHADSADRRYVHPGLRHGRARAAGWALSLAATRLIGYASCSPQSAQACEPAAYSSWTSAHAPMPVEGADELAVVETGKVPREPQGLQATQSRHVAQVLYLLILDGAFARSRRRRGASSARFIELARTSSEPPLSPVTDCMRDMGMR